MHYAESYQGWQVSLTTTQTAEGTWIWAAEIADDVRRETISGTPADVYGSEVEALTAGRSVAAEAIDRARMFRGKP